MKKAIFLALAMALTFSAIQSSWAAPRTSESLATTTNLTDNISNPDSGVPMGTVINWPYEWLPQDSENWRECNGQSLAGTTLCKEKGQCTAPDFRGYFLRGYGGKSGNLGEEQKASIHITKNDNIKVSIDGIGLGGIYETRDTSDDKGSKWNDFFFAFTRSESFRNGGGSGGIFSNPYNVLGASPGSNKDNSFKQNIIIESPSQETRPTNKAVRYLIKVN